MGEPNFSLLSKYVVNPAAGAVSKWLYPDYSQDGDYKPEQWNDWYAKSATHGTEEYRQHLDFLERAEPRLNERLKEFHDSEFRRKHYPDASLEKDEEYSEFYRQLVLGAYNAILGVPPPSGADPSVDEYRQQFLDWMRATSLGGPESPDTSVTPEEYAQWGSDRDYRLTPTGAQAMAKLKDYNLFTAFQTDDHMPAGMSTPMMAGPMGLMGALYDISTTGKVDPITSSQIGATNYDPSPLSAMRYVMQWDKKGQQTDPEKWSQSWLEANIPQGSLINPDGGLKTKFATGDTAYGRATRHLTTPWMMLQHSRADRGGLVDLLNRTDRMTPIGYPENFEEDRRLKEIGDGIEQGTWSQWSMYLPKWIRDVNSVIAATSQAWGGELPDPPPGMKWTPAAGGAPPQLVPMSQYEQEYQNWRDQQTPEGGWDSLLPAAERVAAAQRRADANDPDPYAKGFITPFYGTQAMNDMIGAVPGVMGDPANWAFAGGAGVISGLLSAGQRLPALLRTLRASTIGDVPSESAFNTALSASITPQTPFEYLTEPSPSMPFVEPGEELPAADSPQYMEKLKEYENYTKRSLSDIRNQQNLYPSPELFPPGRGGSRKRQAVLNPQQRPFTNPMSK